MSGVGTTAGTAAASRGYATGEEIAEPPTIRSRRLALASAGAYGPFNFRATVRAQTLGTRNVDDVAPGTLPPAAYARPAFLRFTSRVFSPCSTLCSFGGSLLVEIAVLDGVKVRRKF